MKLSVKLFAGLGVLTIGILISANMSIKKDYDGTIKNDPYWEYGKILEQPFSHINIDGGNLSQIRFEQNDSSCVRVLRRWPGFEDGSVKTFVRGDTLFVTFPKQMTFNNEKQRSWIKHTTLVRIFAPEVVSIRGFDTDFDLLGLMQKKLSVSLAGKSAMEIETSATHLDSLRLSEADSSVMLIEPSPDVPAGSTIHIAAADIRLRGASKLDLGNAHISSLKMSVEDDALINLSGFSINKLVH